MREIYKAIVIEVGYATLNHNYTRRQFASLVQGCGILWIMAQVNGHMRRSPGPEFFGS
jgi:hypothetical protein